MINDDFFLAIKKLLNETYYISAFKLILSSIDSFAFLFSGDIQGNFQIWVDRFLDCDRLGVTPDEIWELRNALLHMTRYESRKVEQGKVKSIVLMYGKVYDKKVMEVLHENKYLDIYEFFQELSKGCQRWLDATFKDLVLRKKFIERYDSIISDTRINQIFVN